MKMKVGDKDIGFDSNGFILNPDLWDEEVAAAIAVEEGIEEMNEKHWAIVRFIREYWEEKDLAPPVRKLCKETGVSLREIYSLFKSGPARGACRVAGIPKPDGCV